MRETSIMDNLNCKTQAHARVCEEKLEEKKRLPIENVFFERWSVRCNPRRQEETNFTGLTSEDTS